MSDVKKKWQDVRSVEKRREAERIRTVRGTGGGPAPVDEAKPWERVVISTLCKSAIQGIDEGIDTSTASNTVSEKVQIGSSPTMGETESCDQSEGAIHVLRVPVYTQAAEEPLPYNRTTAGNLSTKKDRKRSNDGSSSVQLDFLEWEKVKQQKLEEYRARKLEFDNTLIHNQEEIINLQRRSTIALESLVSTLSDNSLTVSPVIKF